MSEKRGATVKLEYPFNTAACLEVQLPNGNWYRITCNEFRSYTYPRRISNMKGKEYVTEEYSGPVYLFGTNIVVNLKFVDCENISNGTPPSGYYVYINSLFYGNDVREIQINSGDTLKIVIYKQFPNDTSFLIFNQELL